MKTLLLKKDANGIHRYTTASDYEFKVDLKVPKVGLLLVIGGNNDLLGAISKQTQYFF